MIPGINRNITRNGESYHIQTEDGGTKNPVITTVLFKGGAVVTARRVSYSDILKFERLEAVLKDIMNEQHNAVLTELTAGHFDGMEELPPPHPAGEKGAGRENPPTPPRKDKNEDKTPPPAPGGREKIA